MRVSHLVRFMCQSVQSSAAGNRQASVMLRWQFLLLALPVGLLLLSACHSTSTHEEKQYRSVWAEVYPDSKAPKTVPGSIQQDFFLCVQADSLEDAEKKWAGFLSRHAPQDGFYEDAVHARYVEWAQGEMERIRLLQNEDAEGEQRLVEKMMKLSDL